MSDSNYESYKPMKGKNALSPKVGNRGVKPEAISRATVKVPVVLAETVVQLDLNPKIDFPEPVLEIKNIKKNLKITQCRLLLPTNKLFIAGFVRKNIQYATPTHGSKDAVVSNIRSLTIDVPFKAVTEIDYIRKPKFEFGPESREFTFFTKSDLPDGFSSKEHLLSADLSQYDQYSGEEYNQLPYCEILSSRFIQYDESLDRKMGRVYDENHECIDAPFEEGTFTKIEEKMVVEVKIKVLQEQQVNIGSRDRKC
ncbi:DUF3794 domain-containing protein [Anaerobacillus alkaliphilus]|uniref:DUF3794 domain-containing protein n=1 Tax=Anaerobacillus alkaliphilus TaxID=1548597 RepID=A0A4Q0VXH3_9BACI|nr:DUF3794 domain-containing protein [Anaerobacillus alkaliphilus]RXJ04229.1 DUF3794 domain-containing protein [Anaerobacillus alkaliphilus]